MVDPDEILKTVWGLRNERLYNRLPLPAPSLADGVFGLPVLVSPTLPIIPTDAENARRIVRHGMADILKWLGEKVGPEPFTETHATLSSEHLFMSWQAYCALRTDPRFARAG